MQQGDRSIEFRLGCFGASNGKVNHAQGVAGVLVNLGSPLARAARKQDKHESGTGVQEKRTASALH
jgi:hypothetical protein